MLRSLQSALITMIIAANVFALRMKRGVPTTGLAFPFPNAAKLLTPVDNAYRSSPDSPGVRNRTNATPFPLNALSITTSAETASVPRAASSVRPLTLA